jgi:ATP synthase protein I
MNEENKLPSLEDLEKKIDKIRQAQDKDKTFKNKITPFNICIEIVASLAAGGLVGYYLDVYFHTKPFLFLICFCLGTAAGWLTLIRLLKKFDQD